MLEFQELANLSVDGIVGSETLNAVYDSGNNIRKENAVFNQVKGTVELLDWFKGGSEWMAKGKNFTITDVRTGLSFRVRRFGGWYHADSVPLTAADTKIMFEISNNSWSWNRRPIWVTSGGRTVAASMHTMPHLSNLTILGGISVFICTILRCMKTARPVRDISHAYRRHIGQAGPRTDC